MPIIERNPLRGWRLVLGWCLLLLFVAGFAIAVDLGFDQMQENVLTQVRKNHGTR